MTFHQLYEVLFTGLLLALLARISWVLGKLVAYSLNHKYARREAVEEIRQPVCAPTELDASAAIRLACNKSLDELKSHQPEKFKAYAAYKRWQQLTPEQRDYAIGFLTGALDMEAVGFTYDRGDEDKARWAITQFDEAVRAALKDYKKEIHP